MLQQQAGHSGWHNGPHNALPAVAETSRRQNVQHELQQRARCQQVSVGEPLQHQRLRKHASHPRKSASCQHLI
jgi:hypothetical protein